MDRCEHRPPTREEAHVVRPPPPRRGSWRSGDHCPGRHAAWKHDGAGGGSGRQRRAGAAAADAAAARPAAGGARIPGGDPVIVGFRPPADLGRSRRGGGGDRRRADPAAGHVPGAAGRTRSAGRLPVPDHEPGRQPREDRGRNRDQHGEPEQSGSAAAGPPARGLPREPGLRARGGPLVAVVFPDRRAVLGDMLTLSDGDRQLADQIRYGTSPAPDPGGDPAGRPDHPRGAGAGGGESCGDARGPAARAGSCAAGPEREEGEAREAAGGGAGTARRGTDRCGRVPPEDRRPGSSPHGSVRADRQPQAGG